MVAVLISQYDARPRVVLSDAQHRVGQQSGAGAARFAIASCPAKLEETGFRQGESLVLRPIRPEDEPQHEAFVERLQPRNFRLLFFSARRELPRSELARLTQIDYARAVAFIAVRSLPDGTAQTLGVVRVVIDPGNVEAEFEVIARSDLKGHGLGHLLMRKMIGFLASVLHAANDRPRVARQRRNEGAGAGVRLQR